LARTINFLGALKMKTTGAPSGTKSTELRLAEVMDIYAKLREVRVFHDPGVLPLKRDCQLFVKDSAPARGTCRLSTIGRDLQYDLRATSGETTVAVIKAPASENDNP
jgi:hypothetical protein